MPIESASYISQLNAGNPGGSDDYATADDHLRLIKAVLQGTFPNATGAINPTPTEFNRLVGIITPLEQQGNRNIASGYAGLNASSQLNNAQVSAANVTQHQAALSVAFTQLTGSISNAQVPAGAVTQHQAALSIAWAQLTGIPSTFTPAAHTHAAADVTTGTFADARIGQSNVTQHQAALALAATQLTSGSIPDLRVPASNVTQHQAALSIATSQLTGTLPDARVAQSNVTQHQAALSIATSQLTGTLADARVAQSNVTQHQAALAINTDQLTTDVTDDAGTAFTVASGDAESIRRFTSASPVTVTLGTPAGGWAAGDSIVFIRGGAGTVSFTGGTIRSPGGTAISVQNGKVCATYWGSGTWELSGNL